MTAKQVCVSVQPIRLTLPTVPLVCADQVVPPFIVLIMVPPFPVEADLSDEATSLGERLWLLKDGKPAKDFSDEQRKYIHLENFYKHDDGTYRVATKNGYALTVTCSGKDISETRQNLIAYIKSNIYISNMFYRTDIGARVEEYYGISPTNKEQQKYQSEISRLKAEIKKIVYDN